MHEQNKSTSSNAFGSDRLGELLRGGYEYMDRQEALRIQAEAELFMGGFGTASAEPEPSDEVSTPDESES
jgi:hypothetical protein